MHLAGFLSQGELLVHDSYHPFSLSRGRLTASIHTPWSLCSGLWSETTFFWLRSSRISYKALNFTLAPALPPFFLLAHFPLLFTIFDYSFDLSVYLFMHFGQLMQRADSWKRPWCWERLKAGGEGDDRGRDGWMASSTQWTWAWASSGRQWRTRPLGVAKSQTRLSDWTTIYLCIYPSTYPSIHQSIHPSYCLAILPSIIHLAG